MRTILLILGLSGCATPVGKLGVDTGYDGTAGGFLGGEEGDDAGPGTDFHAVGENYVSITPVHIDMTKHDAMSSLRHWVEAGR